MKICRGCGARKPLNNFYKHRQMKDGHLNICKVCVKIKVKKYRKANPEKVRACAKITNALPHRVAARKAYAKTDASKQSCKRSLKKLREKWPEKYKARNAVSNGLRDGKITKPDTCEDCARKKKLHGHHEDYSKPLDVIWLCPECHIDLHREQK